VLLYIIPGRIHWIAIMISSEVRVELLLHRHSCLASGANLSRISVDSKSLSVNEQYIKSFICEIAFFEILMLG
jgi:hypothetical protein